MRRSRTTAVLVAVLVGSAVLPGVPSSAQEVAVARPSVSPGKAPAGGSVTISGTGCLLKDTPGSLAFGFAAEISGSAIDLSPLDGHPANADGTWSFPISIPTHIRTAGGERVEVEPGPNYVITTVCRFPDTPSEGWLPYPSVPFEVTTAASSISSDPTRADPTRTDPTGAPAGSTGIPSTSPTAAVPIDTIPHFTG